MWDDVQSYEREFDDAAFDLGWWRGVFDRTRPTRVLELACGTGRLTIPLARHGIGLAPGFEIAGLDVSPPMIARAMEHLAAALPEVAAATSFAVGDMRSFDLGRLCDLIVLGYNGLAYIHTISDQLACLRAVRRHLAPGGRFVIDLIVPQHTFLAEAQVVPPPLRLEIDHALPDEGIEGFYRTCADRYDASTQTIHSTYFYSVHHADGRLEQFTKRLDWHMYYPHELELLMRAAGLEVIERFGNYQGDPFGSRSKQYLWTMAVAE